MQEKLICCQHCGRRIQSRDDLITTLYLWSVVPYHTRCFSHALKGCQAVIVGNHPINSTLSGVMSGLSLLLAPLAVLASDIPSIAGIILLAVPGMRLYSWLAYGRHLD